MICRLNKGVRVPLSRTHLRWVSRELAQRLGAYEQRGLPTLMQSGLATRAARMRAGILGEAAALVYFEQPISNLLTDNRLDGGTDLVIGDLTAQVKTATCSNPRFCYTPPHIPFRADIIVQAALTGRDEVQLIGYLLAEDYRAHRRKIALGGWLNFDGVLIEELHDIRRLTDVRQPGVPF